MDDIADLERRLDALTAPITKAAANDESAKPRGWRFVPYRDEQGLIAEIIARPLDEDV
jgi:hypothetical protein